MTRPLLLCWVSPSFEDTYSQLRPGVRIPDFKPIVDHIARLHEGKPQRRVIRTSASTLTATALRAAGFTLATPDSLTANASPDTTVLMLGTHSQLQQTFTEQGHTVHVLDVSLLGIPASFTDVRDELTAQISERLNVAMRLAVGGLIRRDAAEELIRDGLDRIDERCAAAGFTLNEAIAVIASHKQWQIGDNSISTTHRFATGELATHKTSNHKFVILEDDGSGKVLCALTKTKTLKIVKATSLQTTGDVMTSHDLMRTLIEVARTATPDKIWVPDENNTNTPATRVDTSAGTPMVNTRTGTVGVTCGRKGKYLLELSEDGALPDHLLNLANHPHFVADPELHLPCRVATVDELETDRTWVAYRSFNGVVAPYLALYTSDSGWSWYPLLAPPRKSPSARFVRLSVAGEPLLMRSHTGTKFNAYVDSVAIPEKVKGVMPVFDIAVDEMWVAAFRANLPHTAAGVNPPNLTEPVEVGDAVVVVHGERGKRDTVVITRVRGDGQISSVAVTTSERSQAELRDPAAVGAQLGAGIRFAEITFTTADIIERVGAIGDVDRHLVDQFAAWRNGACSFDPGRVVYVVRPGEEQRPPRPAVVIRCVAGGDALVRPITGSPHRLRETGHELEHPSHISPQFIEGKVRDSEFYVTANQVKRIGGTLSPSDFAHVKARRAHHVG